MQALLRGGAALSARFVHTEARIAKLGYTLPELPQPAGAYKLAVVSNEDGWVYLAGHLPFKEDMKSVHVGRVGAEFTVDEAAELAKIVGLELIASLKLAIGDLDKVKKIVKVNGYIAVADSSVTALPKVLNGCSNLLGEIFEERGVHARVAVGVTTLPLGGECPVLCQPHPSSVLPHDSRSVRSMRCTRAVPVEIDMIAQVEP
jgi:enamine deaminase RidA (YjgF/YER057c/UK114 family)